MSGPTVLVVEDDVWLRRMLERVLRRQGYAVMSADNSGDALARAGDSPHIDLLITDVMFPGGGMSSLVADVRAQHPGVRVLVVSGYDLEGTDELCNLDVAFLAKPFTPTQLHARVRDVLGGAEQAARVELGH